jgi:hypothetical protein
MTNVPAVAKQNGKTGSNENECWRLNNGGQCSVGKKRRTRLRHLC